METESYTIKTSVFEGPFGLLLNLIEKRKLFINDISLSQVTDDYLKHINSMGASSPRDISSFMVIAATLILLKSKSLLPSLDLSDEEKQDIANLTDRLKLYELFGRLSINVKDLFGKRIIFPQGERKRDIVVFLPDEKITRESMMVLAKEALGRVPQKSFLPEVEIKKVISIEEMIDKLSKRIESSMKFSFKEFTGGVGNKADKIEVIVGFLAMLELIRGGLLEAIQNTHEDEIIIERLNKN